jgi:hypothetical protein
MECPICFEQMRAAYQLKGCCHKVCGTCKGRLQEQPESVYYAFQGVYLIEEAPQIQLKCPLCRALEPVKTAEELKAAYPEAYLEWMECELHRDEWGSSFSYTYEYSGEPIRPKPRKMPKLAKRPILKRWVGRKM